MSLPSATKALHAKLDELGREIHGLEGRLAQLQADRATLASALAILDPTSTAHLVAPATTDPLGVEYGRFARSGLDVLRRSPVPLTSKEIAERMVSERGIEAPDKAGMERVAQRVRNTVARMNAAGRLDRGLRRLEALWSVAKTRELG